MTASEDSPAASLANPLAPRVRAPRARTLTRARIDVLVDQLWNHRLTLIVAAAGCGKTTALAQFFSRSDRPVAWYRADVSDSSPDRFLSCLATAIATVVPDFPTQWSDPLELAGAIDAQAPVPTALLIDDLHTLRGTPAEQAFAALIDHLPTNVNVAAATRSHPDIDLSRQLLDGDVHYITSEELRFRTWETETLFRDFYDLRIPPEELARLNRRVRGWPAGLRLYQLAARGKTPIEQRRLVDLLSARSWPMRDYLTRNILDTLRPELRDFLIETSVLGVVTAQLSDELLERTDSESLLRELESLDLLTTPLDDVGFAYHYHEVLRSHLEARLVDRDRNAAHKHLVRAGELLERHGWTAEALHCFGRAEAWESVGRIVGASAPSIGGSWAWLETLPPALVASDPWLSLAAARAKIAAGKILDGYESYKALEQTGGPPDVVDATRRERLTLATWLEPRPPVVDDWHARLRQATRRDPLHAFDDCPLNDPGAAFGSGVAALLGGDIARATRQLASAAAHRDASPALIANAQLAYAIALALGGATDDVRQIDLAEEVAERLEISWLSRVARAAFVLVDVRANDHDEAPWQTCAADGDPWGAALTALFYLWRLARTADPAVEAHGALLNDLLQQLDAPVLSTWVHALVTVGLHGRGHAEAKAWALKTERQARALQMPGARALATWTLAAIENLDAEVGIAALSACGFDAAGFPAPPALASHVAGPVAHPVTDAGAVVDGPVCRLRLFGSFQLLVGDDPQDFRHLRPRVRSLIRFLALKSGSFVHRETLLEALWPNAALESGRSNLHTAISAARQALEPLGMTVERQSDSYCLVVSPSLAIDVVEFESAVKLAELARISGDRNRTYDECVRALSLYSDDLLIDEGPSEWVVGPRDRLRNDAVNAAIAAADIAIAAGEHANAVAACERALALEPYADRAWQLLTLAYEGAGSLVSARRTRQAYREVQQRLGIQVPDTD